MYHLKSAKLSNDVVYSGPPLGAGKELLSSQLLCRYILPWTKSHSKARISKNHSANDE